ncbi:MAG: hypothetical protein R3C17_21875 [Planctomycetaceae bacterium]
MLYLGYCNTRLTDGAGAQIQRILGIYAISRLLGYGYVHFGLSRIGYQGLSALEHDQEIQHLEEMYNTLISLPSDHSREIAHFGDRVFVEFNPDRSTIMGYKERSSAIQRDILLQIVLPFTASDEYPSCYGAVNGLIGPQTALRLNSMFPRMKAARFDLRQDEPVVIGIHVRRGELFAVDSHRMLPNAYYITIALELSQLLKDLGMAYRFDVYAEVPDSPFEVHPRSHGINHRIKGSVRISVEQFRLWEFDIIPELRFRVNEHQISTLYNLANCDILIGSRSSFSYVAGVAGNVRCVLFPRFWHALPPDWVETNIDTGVFDQNLVKQQLLRSRCQSPR